MTTITFDTLAYFNRLKDVGVPEEQARVQAESWRDLNEAQARMLREQAEARDAELRETLNRFDEATRRELATKGDVREAELRLQAEIARTKNELLKWQFSIGLAMLAGMASLAAIMAKGFGRIGF